MVIYTWIRTCQGKTRISDQVILGSGIPTNVNMTLNPTKLVAVIGIVLLSFLSVAQPYVKSPIGIAIAP